VFVETAKINERRWKQSCIRSTGCVSVCSAPVLRVLLTKTYFTRPPRPMRAADYIYIHRYFADLRRTLARRVWPQSNRKRRFETPLRRKETPPEVCVASLVRWAKIKMKTFCAESGTLSGFDPGSVNRRSRSSLAAPPLRGAATRVDDSYLVDPASSHMLVSKIKPCMSKCKPN
jgi:hypothetical protein